MKFIIAALDADSKTFIMHVAIRVREEIVIDPDKKVQIEAQRGAQSRAHIEALLFDKSLI